MSFPQPYAVIIEDIFSLAEAMEEAIHQVLPSTRVNIQPHGDRLMVWMNQQTPHSIRMVIIDRHLKLRFSGTEKEGLSYVRAIRDHQALHPDAKVIVWTSQSDPASVMASKQAGADAFLSKDRVVHTDLARDLRSILDASTWILLT